MRTKDFLNVLSASAEKLNNLKTDIMKTHYTELQTRMGVITLKFDYTEKVITGEYTIYYNRLTGETLSEKNN